MVWYVGLLQGASLQLLLAADCDCEYACMKLLAAWDRHGFN
jgi:hypothetical protein